MGLPEPQDVINRGLSLNYVKCLLILVPEDFYRMEVVKALEDSSCHFLAGL